MTKRMLVVAMLVVASVAGSPSPAAAGGLDDVWDIIDALSGPGPFKGGPVIAATIGCREGRTWKFTRATTDPGKLDPCIFAEFRDLHVEPEGPFSRVTAKLVETGLSFEQYPVLDIGAGLGVAYFATTVGGKDFNVTNFVLTPVRVVVKPLRIGRWENNPRAGALQLHFRATVRFGDIDGADFGVPASTFKAGTEVLRGVGVVIDLLQAVRGR